MSVRIVGSSLISFARFLGSSVAGKGRADNINGLLFVLVLALGVGLASLAFAMGKGGGKPPKDDPPPPTEPIIVFDVVDGMDRLGVVDLDGNHAIILRSELFFANQPHWMPNGQDIVFASDWNGFLGIHRLRIVDDFGELIIDGVPELILEAGVGGFVALPNAANLGVDGVDGLLLAYAAVVPGAQPVNEEIFVAKLNPDGTVAEDTSGEPIVVNITNTPLVGEVYQVLSPDGSRIVYATRDGNGDRDIVVVDITLDSTGRPVPGPGTSLVQGVPDSALRIANDLQQRPLFSLDYSNDTDEIVLGFTPEDSDRDLWVLPVDFPENARPLTVTPTIAEIRPSWSSDDSQIVYRRLGAPPCAKRKGRQAWRLAIRNFEGTPIDGCAEKEILSFGSRPDWRP